MAKKNQQLVLAFFDTEAAADAAVQALKQWNKELTRSSSAPLARL